MTALKDLLAAGGIKSAVVIDDAYDKVPKASDLDGQGIWSTFWADAASSEAVLIEIFPAYSELEPEQLQLSDPFVAAVWGADGKLPAELRDPLFQGYRQAIATDRKFLDDLEARLKAAGLDVIQSGRTPPQAAKGVPLVFVDLFLGATQQEGDIDLSLAALAPTLQGHEKEPPCVVLMSRSELLTDKKERFRDGAGLLGALFRAYSKTPLLEGRTLETTLERLATHRADALRVAKFVYGWKTGLAQASQRFLHGIGRLDLSDYAQIRDVLLAFEGQPLGSYMLDVFDRVLAHEIEGDEHTIDAAQALNDIDPAQYPAPHIAGTTDLQDLVFRTIWQNPKRLKVKTTVDEIPVGFGDVLIRKDLLNGGAPGAPPDAYVVMTAACDLVRKEGAKRVLLLSGTVTEISPKSWTYGATSFKTPIMKLPGDKRVFVRWDAKDIVTLTHAQIRDLLSANGHYGLHLRLREAHALELQQRLLAEMGRIGLVAHMPGTFPVQVEAHYNSPEGLKKYDLEVAGREGGVCYVGRDKDGKEQTRLIMTEAAIDELLAKIDTMLPDKLDAKTRPVLAQLQKAKILASELQKGFPVPRNDKTGFTPIKAAIPNPGGVIEQITVGLIARNPADMKVDPKLAALILVINDAVSSPAGPAAAPAAKPAAALAAAPAAAPAAEVDPAAATAEADPAVAKAEAADPGGAKQG